MSELNLTVHENVADMVIRAAGLTPEHVRAGADRTGLKPMAHADAVAEAVLPHLLIFRELVEAAEMAGWDLTENKDLLNRARDACAALCGEPS